MLSPSEGSHGLQAGLGCFPLPWHQTPSASLLAPFPPVANSDHRSRVESNPRSAPALAPPRLMATPVCTLRVLSSPQFHHSCWTPDPSARSQPHEVLEILGACLL